MLIFYHWYLIQLDFCSKFLLFSCLHRFLQFVFEEKYFQILIDSLPNKYFICINFCLFPLKMDCIFIEFPLLLFLSSWFVKIFWHCHFSTLTFEKEFNFLKLIFSIALAFPQTSASKHELHYPWLIDLNQTMKILFFTVITLFILKR